MNIFKKLGYACLGFVLLLFLIPGLDIDQSGIAVRINETAGDDLVEHVGTWEGYGPGNEPRLNVTLDDASFNGTAYNTTVLLYDADNTLLDRRDATTARQQYYLIILPPGASEAFWDPNGPYKLRVTYISGLGPEGLPIEEKEQRMELKVVETNPFG